MEPVSSEAYEALRPISVPFKETFRRSRAQKRYSSAPRSAAVKEALVSGPRLRFLVPVGEAESAVSTLPVIFEGKSPEGALPLPDGPAA